MYENIQDEALFIARASEGSISVEWILNQPPFIRTKYSKMFQKELKERKEALEAKKK